MVDFLLMLVLYLRIIKKKNIILPTRKIWDLEPKKLLQFYENHICFTKDLEIKLLF